MTFGELAEYHLTRSLLRGSLFSLRCQSLLLPSGDCAHNPQNLADFPVHFFEVVITGDGLAAVVIP